MVLRLGLEELIPWEVEVAEFICCCCATAAVDGSINPLNGVVIRKPRHIIDSMMKK
jgi:hypothetical protein